MTTASSYSDGAANGYQSAEKVHRKNAALVDLEGLPQREPPSSDRPYKLHGKPVPESQPQLFIFPGAAEQIVAHATSTLQSEVGGVLLGAAYRHGPRLHIEVHAALPVRSSDHGPVHFTFNADAWSQVHRERAEQHPGLNIVGWFHTHPGLGIFFSGDDTVVHSAAFVLPWHVALVVDPLSRKMGVFGWQEGELAPVAGFYEIRAAAEGEETALPWTHQKGEIWNEGYFERMAARRRAPGAPPAQLPLPNAWLGIAMGVLGLLVSAVIIVGAVLPLSSRNAALQQVVTGLVEQQLSEASGVGAASCPDDLLRIYAPLPNTQIPSGDEVVIIGFANVREANGYRLDVRPDGEQTWWPLGAFRRNVRGGEFLTWDTASFAPGVYQLRLAATNRAGEELPGAAACMIRFSITAPAPAAS